MRSHLFLAAALLPAAVYSAAVVARDQSFASSIFKATHNSYTGGTRGSIVAQLDAGVRFIEFDIHDNGFVQNGDYSVGHNSPGNEVDHSGGNPGSNLLRDWLAVVNNWSAQHPSAAPIVVALDLKDDLTDNTNYGQGNPAFLNDRLTNAFGSRLFRSSEAPSGLPTIDALRGRVLTVMSGDAKTRTGYKSDTGANPAVARNSRGQVVEVHSDGSGDLWYWSGKVASNGQVTWLRHGRYDSGQTPAVVLNDAGILVEVHQSQSHTTLWYRTATVDPTTGEVNWGPSTQYDNGIRPSIAWTDSSGTALREIHRSQSNDQRWQWTGTLNGNAISWSANDRTSDGFFNKESNNGITVFTEGGLLKYNSGSISGAKIVYEQIMFVEFQSGNSAELQDGAIFYAASRSNKNFVVSARNAGKVVRAWDFDSTGDATQPLANYPATNRLFDAWYVSLLGSSGAIA